MKPEKISAIKITERLICFTKVLGTRKQLSNYALVFTKHIVVYKRLKRRGKQKVCPEKTSLTIFLEVHFLPGYIYPRAYLKSLWLFNKLNFSSLSYLFI